MSLPRTTSAPDIVSALAACEIVDLSVQLDARIACSWPAHGGYQHSTFNWYEEVRASGAVVSDRLGAYYTATLVMDEHTGTHIDAPAHHIAPPDSGLPTAGPAGAITAEMVDLGQLVGAGRVLDVRHLAGSASPGVSPRVEPSVLLEHEERHGRVGRGDIVLLHSGWDHKLGLGLPFDAYAAAPLAGRAEGWPAPSDDLMELLVERGVRTVGTDGPSMGACDEGVGAHRIGLGAGMVFIECMGSLALLPESGAGLVFLGLKIVGGSGAPGRAIGLVPRG